MSKLLFVLFVLLLFVTFGVKLMTVSGTSMHPLITENDVIIVSRQKPADLHPGDIVAFYREFGDGNYTFTHRVVSVGNGTIVTKGDSLPVPDPPVSAADVQGLYLGKITGLGTLAKFAGTLWGYLLFVFLPAAIIIWRRFLR